MNMAAARHSTRQLERSLLLCMSVLLILEDLTIIRDRRTSSHHEEWLTRLA